MNSESPTDIPSIWQPILEGTLAQQARETIEAIADAIGKPAAEWFPPAPTEGGINPGSASFAGGKAGMALLFAYAGQEWSRDDYWEQASKCLEEAIEAVAAVGMPPALYGGFTGIAWTVAHLTPAPEAPGDEDPNEAIDEALKKHLGVSPWSSDYDLISGLVGFGVYALERLPNPAARECLERVIDRLDETAERTIDGITWWTSPTLLPAHQRKEAPKGYYNLGVAHGVPGVIGLLGEACAAGVALDQARPLLDGTVSWLLKQRLPEGAGSWFTYSIPSGMPQQDREKLGSRMAWCYGDPGIAATLLCAARCVGETSWQEQALDIARDAVKCPPDKTGVLDAGLCHGAAGLAQIYNRMFQATREEFLKEAAVYWMEHTLNMKRGGEGIAGYSTWGPKPDTDFSEEPELGWTNDPGFLTGVTGIGLTLLAAVSSLEPDWDRTMLLSIPPLGP